MIDAQDQPIDDATLASLLRNEISTALGSDQDDLQGSRADALEYYFGRKPGRPSTEGRSGAMSNDVSDMVEALKAQIMPTFTGDDIATFEASSPDDEQQAQAESDLVNYQVMERCDGFSVFYEAVHDALLLKNCVVKVYVDEYQRVSKKQYPVLDELALQLLQSETEDELYAEDNDQGTVITRLATIRKLRVQTVDPTNFVVASDQRSLDLQDCRFCAESVMETEGSLIERGYDPDVVRELPSHDMDTAIAQNARNQAADEDEHYWYERSSRPIKVWECYIQIDMDGDGYPELHKVCVPDEGDVILADELVDWIPYACGAPFINPHRWLGISLFDKLQSIQDQKTDLLRSWIDNTRYHNNRRLACVESQTNLDDAVNARPGGIIRIKQQGAVQEIPTSDIGPTILNGLNYLDRQRSERAGASLDMQAQGLLSGDNTAHGVERQMAFKEQMAGMITRTLAETVIKQTFLLVHRTLRHFFPGSIAARKSGVWVESDPSSWGDREHVTINVGMSVGERSRQANALLQVLQMQQSAMQAGLSGVLTGTQQLYNTVTDFCRLAGLDNPSQYWINPASPEAQQAAQMAGMQAQQAAQQQSMMGQSIVQIEAFKAQQQAQEGLRDYEFKVGKAVLDSEVEQAKMTGKQDELNRQQERARRGEV